MMGEYIPHMEGKGFSRSFLDLCKISGKTVTLPIATGSMMPLIRPGDSVKIELVGIEAARSGDMVAYYQGDRIMVHRLLKMEQGSTGPIFWQKGDALSGWGCFDGEAFLGRVETLYRGDAALQMNRLPWRLLNRTLGVAGFWKFKAVRMAQRIKHRSVGNRPLIIFKWMARGEAVGGRALQRLLIRMWM